MLVNPGKLRVEQGQSEYKRERKTLEKGWMVLTLKRLHKAFTQTTS